jgi:hypothetical protein
MNRFVAALAVLSIAASGPALAKHHTSHSSKTAQADTQATSSTDQKSGVPSDLTGQKIYTSTGNLVGTVASMSKDGQGQAVAIVNAEKKLGIGLQKILMPVSQIQPRESGGGYFTNLTQAQVRALPKAP